MSSDDDGYVRGIDRTQELLLPKTVHEYVDAENPVRFVGAFVQGLDMSCLGFMHSKPNDVGRPPYNPKDLLKLYIHEYLKHMRSSRVLGRCMQNKPGDYLAHEGAHTRLQDDCRF